MKNIIKNAVSNIKEIFPSVEQQWLQFKFKKNAIKISNTNCLKHTTERRNCWSELSERICKILQEFKDELASNNVNIYYNNTKKDYVFQGEVFNNFNAIDVVPLNFPSGISVQKFKMGKLSERKLIVQKTGSFTFSQLENGLICVVFFAHIFIFSKKDKPMQYVYGVYEPKELSDAKIRTIIFHGIDFMFNSYYDGKLLPRNKWLRIKEYRKPLLEGLCIGIFASFVVQVIWELGKKAFFYYIS